jgi:hypothetical protein
VGKKNKCVLKQTITAGIMVPYMGTNFQLINKERKKERKKQTNKQTNKSLMTRHTCQTCPSEGFQSQKMPITISS